MYGTQVLDRNGDALNCLFVDSRGYGEARASSFEIDRTEPTNTYGETKLAMEKMMKWCDAAFGLNTCRPLLNVAGASARPHRRITARNPSIPIILQVPLGKSTAVYGDDYETKDGTASGLCQYRISAAHISALEYLKRGKSDIFNLGAEGLLGLRGARTARKITGHPIPAKPLPAASDPAGLSPRMKRRSKSSPAGLPQHRQMISVRGAGTHPNGLR